MAALRTSVLAAFLAVALPTLAAADQAQVAVAANFATVAEKLAREFKAATGHEISLTTGSTGKLYAQIAAGAPFDALLSADAAAPERLEKEGLAVAGTRFTYATGRLALWSIDPALIGPDPVATLADARILHLALANPELAPYGAAAKAVLQTLGVYDAVKGRIVMAENIGQTHAMVKSGAASAGFVAASALAGDDSGSRWDVPRELHPPIRQDAVLLAHGEENRAARGFLAHLAGAQAQTAIIAAGYGTP
ncbi:MAG: molybdate ABC transporter substrate-binding protein [Rhizobiaceae bacterium]